MQLLDLPDEVLEHIASYLDTDSLVALGLTSRRLNDATRRSARSVRVTFPSKQTMQYFESNGAVVRSLDLSNCSASSSRLCDVILRCEHVTRLNVVNSSLFLPDLLRVLHTLHELETLCFGMSILGHVDVDLELDVDLRVPPRLTKLYVETPPETLSFDFILRLLNKCERIEETYVNLIGRGLPYEDRRPNPVLLAADRWETLHTFVCSRHLSNTFDAHIGFLERVFGNRLSPDVQRWIHREQKCYIYERGNFNGMRSAVAVAAAAATTTTTTTGTSGSKDKHKDVDKDKLKLLTHFHEIDLAAGDGEFLRPPWGCPRALRVTGYREWLTRIDMKRIFFALSSNLVELDLTGLHASYTEKTRLGVIAAAPCLEALAVPLCFALAFEHYETPQRVVESWQRRKLKNLIIKGNAPDADEFCDRCCEPMNADNFGPLCDLEHLRELTCSMVTLETTAYDQLANSNVHTVRLYLDDRSSFLGLRRFIARCPKLENFKLDAEDLPLNATAIWEALAEGANLKRLCLASESFHHFEVSKLRDVVLRIVDRLELLHVHIAEMTNRARFQEMLRAPLIELSSDKSSGKTIYLRPAFSSLGQIGHSYVAQSFLGRSLCCCEGFVGTVKPVGWDVD